MTPPLLPGAPGSAEAWHEPLAGETPPPAHRDAIAARLKGTVAREPLAVWRAMGPPGLEAMARLDLGERVQHDVGEVGVLDWAEGAGVLAGRRLVRLGSDLHARWSASLEGRPLGVFVAGGRVWAVQEKPGGADVFAAWADGDGRPLGAWRVRGEVGAVRVDGEDVVIWGWDTSGHPTDRSAWRVAGRLGGRLGSPEVAAEGPTPAPRGERWDWVRGAGASTILPGGSAQVRGGAWIPGHHRALVDTGHFVVSADVDGLLWLRNLDGTPLAVRAPHPRPRLLACRDADVLVADADGGVRVVTIRP